jgi:hypothetical protein
MKLFVLLVVLFLFILWKKNQRRQSLFKDAFFSQNPFDPPGQGPQSPNDPNVMELLPCAICGVHAAKNALKKNGRGEYVCPKHGA